MQWKDEVVSVELREGGLLVDDHAGGDFPAIRSELVDSLESTEMRCMLLPYEVDGGICSRSQRSQAFIVVETGGASDRLGRLDEDVV